MNKEITTQELFTELIKKLKNKEIYLKIDDKTANGSLYLVAKGSLPTVSIKIGEVYCNLAYFQEN